jgi:hypothetical protein
MDAGVTTHCTAVSCGQPQIAIPLGGQTPSVDSFTKVQCHGVKPAWCCTVGHDDIGARCYGVERRT